MKIVIVEDEIRIKAGIETLLKRMGDTYQVVATAENGLDGLFIIKEHQPDLIITDIKMQKKDGLEMLQELRANGCTTQVIVLSAYSEFTYAQQAVKLGVTEYLLKPIELENFEKAVRNSAQLVAQQTAEKTVLNKSLSSLFAHCLVSQEAPDNDILFSLAERLSITEDMPVTLAAFYLGADYDERALAFAKRLRVLLAQRPEVQGKIISIPKNHIVMMLVFSRQCEQALVNWLENYMAYHRRTDPTFHANCVVETVQNLSCLQHGFQRILTVVDWNIAQPELGVIQKDAVQEVPLEKYPYDRGLEVKLKTAMCNFDAERAQKICERFFSVQPEKGCFSPKEIKESTIRFLWSAIGTAKEVGAANAMQIDQQALLQRIILARDAADIRLAFFDTMQNLFASGSEPKQPMSLLIKRATALIQKNYATGITLEELARQLHITPEYLGTQLHKEMGETFGSYIRSLRIEMAKKLLIGTEKKIYEIAEEIGYSDSKYFSRVFKEASGCLPAEYRKMQK